jgi:Fibronectin type III domain
MVDFNGLVFSLLSQCMQNRRQSHRVSIRFSRLSDSALNTFTSNVITSLTGNAAFPAPLVPLSELISLQQAFNSALIAAREGGQQATAAKNNWRASLLTALRRQAIHVQSVSGHDLSLLLSSGYSAASQNRTPTPLARPAVVKVLNEQSAKLTLRLTPVPNTRSYQVQTKVGEGEWQDAGIFPQARRIEVTNLKPGTLYSLRVRAIGGSTGHSDWSDPTSRMSL